MRILIIKAFYVCRKFIFVSDWMVWKNIQLLIFMERITYNWLTSPNFITDDDLENLLSLTFCRCVNSSHSTVSIFLITTQNEILISMVWLVSRTQNIDNSAFHLLCNFGHLLINHEELEVEEYGSLDGTVIMWPVVTFSWLNWISTLKYLPLLLFWKIIKCFW